MKGKIFFLTSKVASGVGSFLFAFYIAIGWNGSLFASNTPQLAIILTRGGNDKKAVFRDDAVWVQIAGSSGFSRLALYFRELDNRSEKKMLRK
jgi:hypothetical protein